MQIQTIRKDDKNWSILFEQEFVDSLILNRKVYKFTLRYADRAVRRSTSNSGMIFAKTCMVKGKGKKSTNYTLVAKGIQYIAVVTEPKGLVTLRIHDKTNDKWYNGHRRCQYWASLSYPNARSFERQRQSFGDKDYQHFKERCKHCDDRNIEQKFIR